MLCSLLAFDAFVSLRGPQLDLAEKLLSGETSAELTDPGSSPLDLGLDLGFSVCTEDHPVFLNLGYRRVRELGIAVDFSTAGCFSAENPFRMAENWEAYRIAGGLRGRTIEGR